MTRLGRAFRALFTSQPTERRKLSGLEVWAEARRRGIIPLAKYDAAGWDDENRRHWSAADGLSANAANSPEVRRRLRNRSRYECANNGYAKGSCESYAQDLVGTGPRPEVTIPGASDEVNSAVEAQWALWAAEERVDLADKFRVAAETDFRDGEVFGLLINDAAIAHPVKLNLTLVEAERVATPDLAWNAADRVDGIKFDSAKCPVSYDVLREHPGDGPVWIGQPYDTVPAESVIHWFRPTRPGQARGVPRTTAGLNLFAQLRRMTLATLTAAEYAACLAGIMETELEPTCDPVDGGIDTSVFDKVPLERGQLLSLPYGFKAHQFQANQPTATYGEFKREVLNESGRGAGQPLNIVTGNSSGYNFSSGRLDHLPYQRSIYVERNRWRVRALTKLFRAWVQEAALAGVLPPALPPVETWVVRWYFDGFESIDPAVDAKTDDTRLANNTTTLAEIWSARGRDWRNALKQRALERQTERELNIEPPAKPGSVVPAAPPAGDTADAAEAVGVTRA